MKVPKNPVVWSHWASLIRVFLPKSLLVHIGSKFIPTSTHSWQFSGIDAIFLWIYGYQIFFAAENILLLPC